METKKDIIVAFHIGRGGLFNNGGYPTFLGEMDFQQLQKLYIDHIFYRNRNKEGKFVKTQIWDTSKLISEDDPQSPVGMLDFDGEYNTAYCKYLNECTDEEIEIIAISDRYKSLELLKYLEDYEYNNNLKI